MLELYHSDTSVCSAKVRFALAEKKIAFTAHHLDLRTRDQQRPEYVKLNPNSLVPTLVHDGEVIIESTVINEYIDECFGGLALRPESVIGRARMRLWTKKLDEGINDDCSVVSGAIAFRHEHLAKGTEHCEARLKNIPNPAKRERYRASLYEGVNSRFFAGAIRRFDAMLGRLETTLSEKQWLAGTALSLADIGYSPYVARLDHLQLSEMWHGRPHVAAWYERVKAREGYRTGVSGWFSKKYVALMEKKGREDWPRIAEILAKTTGLEENDAAE